MSIAELKKDIKEKNIRSVYLFYGPEEYLIRHYTLEIRKLLVSDISDGLNYAEFQERVDVGRLIDFCDQYAILSDRKLAVVKKSGLFKSGRKGDVASDTAKLISYINNGSPGTCLIFIEEEVDGRLKITDAVKKSGLVVEFPVQKSADLAVWIKRIINANGKVIDGDAVYHLLDLCEHDMTQLHTEVEKLLMYTAERDRVVKEDVDVICTKTVKSKVFDLIDALVAKNAAKALLYLDELLFLKEPVPRILLMMGRHFRQLIEATLFIKKGCRKNELAGLMKLHPYAAEKLYKQAVEADIPKLKKALKNCLEADVAIKTGKMPPRTAVELVITSYAN